MKEAELNAVWSEANKDKIRGCLVRHPHLRENCIFVQEAGMLMNFNQFRDTHFFKWVFRFLLRWG
ncbi:hypothetical protein SAMN02746098_04768 [Desulfosporosinus lacus DSM 15449]|uniref:Uncharacterized protein n=1 Tax=Desulfosporosinus lacus DSM 15449 TaxID=1121420 RepID=A0A1M6EL17_9FIRM|nr:hypothetical protein SAMN02746098_04768 [Desulfosporosinus lacus DSM 15449]